MMTENRCVCCGQIIPEGDQVCISCKNEVMNYDRQVTRDRKIRNTCKYLLEEWIIPVGLFAVVIVFLILVGKGMM